MYKLTQKIDEDIWYNPIFYDEFLIINKKNKVVVVYNLGDLSPIAELESKDISYIRNFDNILFCDNGQDCFIYDIEDIEKKPELIVGITALPAYLNDNYIYSNCKINSSLMICKYDYRNLKEVAFFDNQLSSSVQCFDDRMIFSENTFFSRKINCIDKNTGQEYWVYDVSESGKVLSQNKEKKGKVNNFLVAIDDTLLVSISNSKLIKLNINTGELIWLKDSINDRLKLYEDKLINVDAGSYREISIETGETLVEYEMRSAYKKHGFRTMGTNSNFTITDTHVFIVDAMGFKMGCINRSTGEIDWSTEVGEGKVTLPHAPIVYQDKLYVLDDEGTLHIYEKEELAT